MVTVRHGADHESAELAGQTIADVRNAYESVFNIPESAIVKANDHEVNEEYVIKDGDKILFDKNDDKFTTANAIG